jgi:hypothetical protein
MVTVTGALAGALPDVVEPLGRVWTKVTGPVELPVGLVANDAEDVLHAPALQPFVQVVCPPALQLPAPLHVDAAVRTLLLQEAAAHTFPLGKTHAPDVLQSVAPHVPPVGVQAAAQQCVPVPPRPQMPLVHSLLAEHAAPGPLVTGQVLPVRVRVAMQLCDVPVPPQSTVSCAVAGFHVPVQPVRWAVPSCTVPFAKAPVMSNATVPLSADPAAPCETSWTWQEAAPAWMHWGTLARRSPHPAPVLVTL